MKVKNGIKGLDLFSLPFQFQMNQSEKVKKTLQGGILSIIIIASSMAYLLYLSTQYFTSSLQPKIAVFEEFSNEPFEIDLDREQIKVTINLKNGSTLLQYEQIQNKRYLILYGQIVGKDGYGNIVTEDITFQRCNDDDISYCFNYADNAQTKKLLYNKEDSKKRAIYLYYSECVPQYILPEETCATLEESNQLLINLGNSIQLEINLSQYNTKEKQFQNKTQLEYYIFDSTTSFVSQIFLQKAHTTVKEGLIFQGSERTVNIQSYQRMDIQAQKDYLFEQFQYNLYGLMIIQVSGSFSNYEIQYPQYTEVLAQFSSILNSLLILGLFGKMIAKSEIMQDLAQIQLQHYYKKSAYKLLTKEELSQFSDQGVTSIIDLNNYITKQDLQKKWSKKFQLNFYQRLKIFLFSTFGSSKKNELQEKQQFFKNLVQKTNASQNIYSIQKDLLQIKIILKMLLTPEQYAAIQLCGCDIVDCQDKDKNDFNQQLIENNKQIPSFSQFNELLSKQDIPQAELISEIKNIKDQVTQKNKIVPASTFQTSSKYTQNIKQQKMNHLEKIDMVDRDPTYFKDCIESFIQKVQQNRDDFILKDLNQRIYDCIVQIDQKQLFELNQIKETRKKEIEQIDYIDYELSSFPQSITMSPQYSHKRQQNE